jgi:ABC-type transport system involved in cytochrome c biogenesis permease subunit
MKLRIFLCFIFLFYAWSSQAQKNDFNYDNFAKLPILQDGLVVSLDNFAKRELQRYLGEDHEKSTAAINWLALVLFAPDKSYDLAFFKIKNKEVRATLGLQEKEFYNFREISKAINKNFSLLSKLEKRSDAELSFIERELIEIYFHNLRFFQLSRSLSILTKKSKDLDKKSSILRIIPPQINPSSNLWHSPWQLAKIGAGTPDTANYLKSWQQMRLAYLKNDAEKWQQASLAAFVKIKILAKDHVDFVKLYLSDSYEEIAPVRLLVILYFLTFLACCFYFAYPGKNFIPIIHYGFVASIFSHFLLIVSRVYILGRAPVANLYESVIFVSFIAAIASYLFARKRLKKEKDNFILFIAAGAFLSFLLSVIAFAMQPTEEFAVLAAVLNSNFWLATHVLMISTAYAIALLAGILAHILLFMMVTNKITGRKLQNFDRSILVITILALFFTITGTILGGIWADQSWGRFWGWDPKENGALLLALWLIWILHARLIKSLTIAHYNLALVITNIIIALSWFGVNLLNVGLHSYGFTDDMRLGTYLFSFAAIELSFILYIYIKLKKQKIRLAKLMIQ